MLGGGVRFLIAAWQCLLWMITTSYLQHVFMTQKLGKWSVRFAKMLSTFLFSIYLRRLRSQRDGPTHVEDKPDEVRVCIVTDDDLVVVVVFSVWSQTQLTHSWARPPRQRSPLPTYHEGEEMLAPKTQTPLLRYVVGCVDNKSYNKR